MVAATPKIWKSYAEQMTKLQDHGLDIDCGQHEAVAILEKIGYYRLSGYAYSSREIDP